MNKKTKSIVLLIISVAMIVGLCLVSAIGVGSTGTGSAKNIILGLDLRGGVSITYEAVDGVPSAEAMADTRRKLQKRAEIYSTEADVYLEGDKRIVVNIPGQNDAEKVKEELGKPGALSLVANQGSESEVVVINGSDIEDAKPYTNTQNGGIEYAVSLKLTSEGTQKFAEATKTYLNKTIAIVYDGDVISAPVVRAVITNGECTVDGMNSYEEAEELASMLRIGSLKVELKDISSNVIGPKLGEKAIETSLLAGLIGIIIVIIFMIAVYRIPGVAASLALVLYIVLDLLALNGFDMTLTLPGIAGIILAIGMAVDANVIIFARIREELAAGSAVDMAIKTGFKKSTSAILDGNITTFIAALVLMFCGSGTIKGFAQTLAVGIVLSIFTAMIASRFFVNVLYNMGLKDKKFYGVQKERKTIDFLKKRVVCIIISGVIILVGVVTMALGVGKALPKRENPLNYSVEFIGGKSLSVEFKEAYTIDEFNSKIKPEIVKVVGDEDVTGSIVEGTNGYNIRMKLVDDATNTKLKKLLVDSFGAVEASIEEINISATVGNEMKKDAIVAVIIATICMLIYIFIRFRDIRFASSAVIALIHDILIVLAFYAVSWTTVGNTFIACMLTILGYSINATIVIFDRIRENLKAAGSKADVKEIVNKSITQTLTRSIYTSFTTLVMVVMLSVLGVAAMRDFAIPLLVGIVAGGYSSVFLTGAIWYMMSKKKYK